MTTERIKKSCAVCGREFLARDARRKTCSHRCSVIHRGEWWKAYMKAYNQRPYVKAYCKKYMRAYFQRPEVKARARLTPSERRRRVMEEIRKRMEVKK